MNTKKNFIGKKQIIFFLLMCLIPMTSEARYGEHPWSFGVISGISVGYQSFSSDSSDCGSGGFSFICSLAGAFAGLYGTVPILATGAYRFNKVSALRLSLGIDIYLDGTELYDGAPIVFPAAEARGMFHLKEKRSAFHPYFLAGLRFPVANPAIGIGNEFSVGEKASLWLEVMANSVLQDTKVEARLGVVFHY